MINLNVNVNSEDPKLEKKLRKKIGKILKKAKKYEADLTYSIDTSFAIHPQIRRGYVRGYGAALPLRNQRDTDE